MIKDKPHFESSRRLSDFSAQTLDVNDDSCPQLIQLTDAEEKLVLRLRQIRFGMAILCFSDGDFTFVLLPKLEKMAN